MAASKPRLFEYLTSPDLQLQSPSATLSPVQFDRLKITVDDFRFVTRDVTDDLGELQAELRSRATILRRLLCDRDLFHAGRHFAPEGELRVRARMLDFEPPHPVILMSCGNYPWQGDRLPGIAMEFSIQGYEQLGHAGWSYREDADVTLADYLDGLAIAVLGTPIRRREVIKYVADKKAAHVSERRKFTFEQAMDRAWALLSISVQASNGPAVSLNIAYLEILSLITALAESETINDYINRLAAWLGTATPIFPPDKRRIGENIPPIRMDPINRD